MHPIPALYPEVSQFDVPYSLAQFYNSHEMLLFDSLFWWCLKLTTGAKCPFLMVPTIGVQILQLVTSVKF